MKCVDNCSQNAVRGLVRCDHHDKIHSSLPKCEARTWDNGDTTDCGKIAVRANRCSSCLDSEVSQLKAKIKAAEAEVFEAQLRLAQLEDQRP